MDKIEIRSFAKINLTLDVISRRADGYHELNMVMHSIGIYDVLIVSKRDDDMICIDCAEALPHNNTVRRAAELYMRECGCKGVDVLLKKGIPSEAGLGGASADAAGMLRAMEFLYGKIDEERLYSIGKAVGADVPFCLHGGCALVGGIGEKLKALPPLIMPLLIVKGERGVSTGALFKSLSEADMGGDTKKTAEMVAAISLGSVHNAAQALSNALSPAAEKLAPEIADYRARLIEAGAIGACMTGSGSAVFGIFDSLESAKKAQRLFSDCAFSAVCETKEQPFISAAP